MKAAAGWTWPCGLPWPQQLFDDGDPELIGDPDSDPDGWLWVDPEGSRPGWQDMADFATMIEDAAASTDLTRAIEGRGAFRRFQQALDRHDQYRAAWRVHTSERRTGRARAWLADAGYDALPYSRWEPPRPAEHKNRHSVRLGVTAKCAPMSGCLVAAVLVGRACNP